MSGEDLPLGASTRPPRTVRFEGSKVLFRLLLVLFFLMLPLSWFFFSPSSPYYRKDTYTFRTMDNGGLEPGAPVLVLGLASGRVERIERCGDAVCVTATLTEGVRMPVSSTEALIFTEGLVGTRVLKLQFGAPTPPFYKPGDTVVTQSHPGPTYFMVVFQGLNGDLGATQLQLESFVAFLDSLDIGPKSMRIKTSLLKTSADLRRLGAMTQDSLKVLDVRARTAVQSVSGLANDIDSAQLGPRWAIVAADLRRIGGHLDSIRARFPDTLAPMESWRAGLREDVRRTNTHVGELMTHLRTSKLELNADLWK